jgi:hypothetical protein
MEVQKLNQLNFRLITGFWLGEKNCCFHYTQIICCVPILDKNFEKFRVKFSQWKGMEIYFSYISIVKPVGLS